MKKLISICLLLFLVVCVNAQEKSKSKYSEFNQDQLNLALKQASKSIKTGKILTFVGAAAFTTGVIIFASGVEDALNSSSNSSAKLGGGYALFLGGFVSTLIGIPVWIVGASKKNKIELELVKFNPKGSSSINGIGLKIRF
jgi:hypothetical protein